MGGTGSKLPAYDRSAVGPLDSLASKMDKNEVERIVSKWPLAQIAGTYVALHRDEEDRIPLDKNPNKHEIGSACASILTRNGYSLQL